ncbi:hypothetical protein BO70DRAFT_411496, partial [Aspergillus heteromorphus CBS 117.55]
LDCSPTNRERELGLDRRETGRATVIHLVREDRDSDNWFLRLSDQAVRDATILRIMD